MPRGTNTRRAQTIAPGRLDLVALLIRVRIPPVIRSSTSDRPHRACRSSSHLRLPASGSMLLWFGKWVRGTVLDDQGGQRVEDLAGDVALQASDDFGLRQAFVGAALGVGAGAWVVAEAAKNDNGTPSHTALPSELHP